MTNIFLKSQHNQLASDGRTKATEWKDFLVDFDIFFTNPLFVT